MAAELTYLDAGLTKNDLIILVALMGINKPMRVKILEKFNSAEGCSLDDLRLYANTVISANPGTAGSCNAAQGKKQGEKKKKESKKCSLCSMDGHDLAGCWKNPSGANYKHCSTCSRSGHTSDSCRDAVPSAPPAPVAPPSAVSGTANAMLHTIEGNISLSDDEPRASPLMVVQVASEPAGGAFYKINMFADTGASHSFVSEALCLALKIPISRISSNKYNITNA